MSVTAAGHETRTDSLTTAGGLKTGWGVSPERQQEIVAALSGIAPGTGRLTATQLRAITTSLAARRELWSDLVVRDPDVRWYLPLHRSNSCDVWLLAWERGQDTDWHDHGGSSGSFAVADGSLTEQYRVPSGRLSRRRGELESDFPQRDGLGELPSGGGEQRGPGDAEAGRIVPGRLERQAVAMFGKVRPHPQPVTLAGGQRPGSWHPVPAWCGDVTGRAAGTGLTRGPRPGRTRRAAS